MPGERIDARLTQLTVNILAPDVALVPYVSEVGYDQVQRSQRSSLWVRHGSVWQLRFHQGTAI